MGFTQPVSHLTAGELLPHHFALTRQQVVVRCMDVAGRYVSVALSLRSPSLAVSQHSALWSSDFPRTLQFAIACLTHTHIIRVSQRGLLYKDGDPHIFSIDGLCKNTLQWQLNHVLHKDVRRVFDDNGSKDSPYIACQLRWLSVENGARGPGAGTASIDFPCRST